MGSRILSIFEAEGEGGKAVAQGGIKALMERHRAHFPDNLKLLEAPPYHKGSDAVRFNRLAKDFREKLAVDVRTYYGHPQRADEISVRHVRTRGSFKLMTVEFYGQDVEERMNSAITYQHLFYSAGFPLAVTVEGELHNPDLHSALTHDQLCLAELGEEATGATEDRDVPLDELFAWKDSLPAWGWGELASWCSEGFTPQEAEEWRADEDRPPRVEYIFPECARGWKDAGQSKAQMDEWLIAGGIFRDFHIARDWVAGGAPPNEAIKWVVHGFIYNQACAFRSAGLDFQQARHVRRLMYDPSPQELLSALSLDEIYKLLDNGYEPEITRKLIRWLARPGRLTRDEIMEWAIAAPAHMCGPGHRSRWIKAGLTVFDMIYWRPRLKRRKLTPEAVKAAGRAR